MSEKRAKQPRTGKMGLTTGEAAKLLGVGKATVRKWADLGYLEAYRTPAGHRRFNPEQLQRFLLSSREGRNGAG